MARNKLVGQPRPPEVKEKISKSQQERHRKAREQGLPPMKRCSKCKKMKPSPKEFGWCRRKLVSGEWAYHPRSICKVCSRERAAAYREKLRKEGVYSEKLKEYRENRKKKREKGERSFQKRKASRDRERERRNAYKRKRRAEGKGDSA